MRGSRGPGAGRARNDVGRTIEEIVLARRTFPWLYPDELGGASGPSVSRPQTVTQDFTPHASTPSLDGRARTASQGRRLRTRGRPRSQQLPRESSVMRLHEMSRRYGRRPSLEALQTPPASMGAMGTMGTMSPGDVMLGFAPSTPQLLPPMSAPGQPQTQPMQTQPPPEVELLKSKAEELAAKLAELEEEAREAERYRQKRKKKRARRRAKAAAAAETEGEQTEGEQTEGEEEADDSEDTDEFSSGEDEDEDDDDNSDNDPDNDQETRAPGAAGARREVPGEGYGLDVDQTLLSLGTTITRLDRVFHEQDGEAIIQEQSANVIIAIVRMFVTRCKYHKARAALAAQRERGSHRFMRVIHNFVEREKRIAERVDLLLLTRDVRLVANSYKAWAKYTLDQRPTREARIRRAMEQSIGRVTRLLRAIMSRWRAVACGDRSRKKVAARYKQRVDAARERLRQQGIHGIITPELIQRELRLQAVQHMRERKYYHVLRIVFRAWFTDGMEELQRKKRRAHALYARHLVERVFPVWVQTHRRLVMGSYQKEWEGLVRWERPQNQRRIRLHAELACERRHFRHWAAHVQRRREVRARYQASVTHLCRKVFTAFTTRLRFQRDVKRVAVDEWRAYGQRLQQVPFQAWYVWTHQRRTKKRAQNTLIFAYRRRRNRSLAFRCFRAWRYQVLYGRVEAMHTKIELIQALEEQKALSATHEENLRRYKEVVDSMQGSLDAQEQALQRAVLDGEKRDQEVTQLKFAIHNSEQEIVRLRSQMDAVEQLHPGTVRRLREAVAEDIEFEERQLDPLARERHDRMMRSGVAPSAAADLVPSDDEADPLAPATARSGLGADDSSIPADEKLRLERVQWVSRRLDLLREATDKAPAPPPLPPQQPGPVDPATLRLFARAEHSERVAASAIGLLHFLLSGDGSLIPEADMKEVESGADEGGGDDADGAGPATDPNALRDPEARAYFDRTHFAKPKLPRADLGRGLSWADFLSGVRVRFPTRKEPTGADRLGRAVFEAKRHAAALRLRLETEEKQAINLYSRAPQLG